jgi:hypothetical protein
MGGFERHQARRRTIYNAVTFFGVVFVGIVLIVAMFVAGRRRVHTHLYRDPDRTLLYVFAERETRWCYVEQKGSYASLEELVRAGGISDEFLDGPVEGYRYRIVRADKSGFVATADPEGPPPAPEPGEKPRPADERRPHFYVDETHTIRFESDKPAGPESPVFWSPRDAIR